MDPGSRIQGQKDPGSASKNLNIFNQKNVSKLMEKWSGMFIMDPWSRIQIRICYLSQIPDPDSGSRFQKSTGPGSRFRIGNTGSMIIIFFKKYVSHGAPPTYTGRPAASHQSTKRTGVPVLLLLLPGLHGAGQTTTAGHNQPHQVPSLQPPAQAPLSPHCGWDFRCIKGQCLDLSGIFASIPVCRMLKTFRKSPDEVPS